jgi:Transposase IS200 like
MTRAVGSIGTVRPRVTGLTQLDVRRKHSAVYTLNVHLVFVTKDRRPVFTDPMLSFSEHPIREVCADLGAQRQSSMLRPTTSTS